MQIDKIELFRVVDDSPILVSGPCSAESEEQVMKTAEGLSSMGIKLFRAGIWKPRTKPGGFEGVGEQGLKWMQRARQEYGMAITTEVATAAHVEACLKAEFDLLWIGARTTTNPFAMQEIADALKGVDIPVLVKNPVNPDLELWIGAFERLYNAGITKLGAIHRGFSSYSEKVFRNSPQWQIPIELHRRLPELPIFCDPSHIAGKRELLQMLCQQALDLDFDGLFVETHCDPHCALSDSAQQLTPDDFKTMIDNLVRRSLKQDSSVLEPYRAKFRQIDDELMDVLARRMELSREIAEVKKNNGITVLQPYRYNEILEKCSALSITNSLDVESMKRIFGSIHSESVQQQLMVINGIKR